MKTRLMSITTLAFAVALISTNVLSEEDPMAAAMAKAKKWTEPGRQHHQMAYFIGHWDVETQMIMPGMKRPPTKGTAEYKWLIPGRWISVDLKGTMLGAPMQSFGIHGFDNFKKKWVTTWVSSMDTAMNRSEGVIIDPTGKVRAEYGTLDEYLNGEHDKPFRTVTRRLTDDKFENEVWDLGIGEAGAIVIKQTFTRKK
jgi:hypothetical protein